MDLTIIIPCKNEEKYIGNLLKSLSLQEGISNITIIIADAGSTDNTIQIIESFSNLNIKIIKGGLPAIGRNRGAELANTKYLLFIDADVEIYQGDLIAKSVSKMDKFDLYLLTGKLNSKNLVAKIFYLITNLLIVLSKLDRPFSVGSFMMMRRDVFNFVGKFPEDVLHCEDYLLSKEIDSRRFGIIDGYFWMDNRRFKKMGYFGMVKYIIFNIFNRKNYDYFKKDIKYWE